MVRVSLPAPPVTASRVTPEKATAGPPLMLVGAAIGSVADDDDGSSAAVPLMVSVAIANLRCVRDGH